MATLTTVFNGAQTFFIDPSRVGNAKQIMISSIDLYFKHKPSLTGNYSGVATPSVSVFIVETLYGVPHITRQSGIFNLDAQARVTYYDIQPSSDATVPTKFRFPVPVLVDTNKEYAIVWRFDYLDQFQLWTSKQGDILVGTTNSISPGPSGQFIGSYFDFFNMFVVDDSTDLDTYLKNWRPIADTDLKFTVYCARYSHGGTPVTANSSIDISLIHDANPVANISYDSNSTTFDIRFGSYEYMSFDQETSIKYSFVGGQNIFQNTFSYPGGWENNKTAHTISAVQGNNQITAQTNLPNGAIFQWSNLFPANVSQSQIVFRSGNLYNVRQITQINSNTKLTLSEPLTFTNTAAEFLITPIGQVGSFEKQSPFGLNESYVIVANSTANSSVRFVNNTIESIAVSDGGTGYQNNDILYITGYEDIATKVNGGYMAKANLVTNSIGGITSIYISNAGCGFVNTAAIKAVVANSVSGNTSGNTSSGSGATFTYSIGATLRTELTPNIFRGVKVRNIDIGEFLPYFQVVNPPGINYTFSIEMPYYRQTSNVTYSGLEYYVSNTAANNRVTITMYSPNYTETMAYTPVLPSKSNEFVIKYADGSVNDKISNTSSQYSLAFRLIGNTYSNSDFTCPILKGLPSVNFSKYIINNDANNEHTDSGNAWARHITKITKFQRPAEDIRVYLTAYNPANTGIRVYARIHKNEDPDSFDDANWTLLEQKNTSDLSSGSDTSDYVEQEFGFYQYPQDRTKLAGVAKTTLSSATVTGVGTSFLTDLASGSVVLLRQELFPDNHIVAVVSSVASDTSLTLVEPISNTSLVAEGLKIERIDKPHQAFNNIQKDNVVRYFNSSITKFDGYDQVAIKVVFLSDSPHRVPRIDDVKLTGVSS